VLTLVTGGSGLLGHCLVHRLLAHGDRVRVVDLVPPREAPAGTVEFRRGDLRDAALVREACAGVDVVYHLAALQRMKAHELRLSERGVFDANVAATTNVLAGAFASGTKKVVAVSSSGVYGVPRSVPVTEDHPQRPIGSYGRSKVRSEELCREYLDRGLDVTMLRPVSLFGPWMKGIFLMLFEWVRTGRPAYILGHGRNRVELACAWDVADACILAAERPESRGEAMHLGSDGVPTVREQVEALIRHAGSRSRVVALPAAPIRAGARVLHALGVSPLVPEHYLLADCEYLLDTSRARRVLGWTPRYTNVSMMNEAYDWYVRTWPAARPEPHPVLRWAGLVPDVPEGA
jgi:nucleoside-diphosphate-sugar epimerase